MTRSLVWLVADKKNTVKTNETLNRLGIGTKTPCLRIDKLYYYRLYFSALHDLLHNIVSFPENVGVG